MKKHNIIFGLIAVLALVSTSLTSCYEDFDAPADRVVYTDADFEGVTKLTIKQLKQKFYDVNGTEAASVGKNVIVTDDVYISGKVISSDADGNVYKTVYIQDETGAIEIKLGQTNLYNEYRPGTRVYVRCKGLCIGSYRYMLSLGLEPSEDDKSSGYANTNFDLTTVIRQHVFRGAAEGLNSADTLVVTSAGSLKDPDDLGRLVRFKNLTSKFGTYDRDEYPQFLEQTTDQSTGESLYNNYTFQDCIDEWKAYYAAIEAGGTPTKPTKPEPGNMDFPTWAFNNGTGRYYGSALFTLGADTYIVRSSGYSRFALRQLTPDGSHINLTAIYCKYSSKTGGYIKYQLLINGYRDIVPLDYVPVN